MNTRAVTGSADEGSIVLGWLTKLVISLAVLGLVVFDGIALVSTTLNAADHATQAASLAAENYAASKSAQAAYDAAEAEVAKNGEKNDPKRYQVLSNGHVTLTVHKTATTLWMHRIGFLRKYTEVERSGGGSPAT